MTIRTEKIDYSADGLAMVGTLVFDDMYEVPQPGVLVFPEIFGPGRHVGERAERLAHLGYVAMACDLHGEGREFTDLAEAMPLLGALRSDNTRIRARARGALNALTAQPRVDPARIAAIGFCFGGMMALELGRDGANLAAIVGFHSTLSTDRPAQASALHGRVLVCIGADDPHVDARQRAAFEEEMRGAGVGWEMHVYGGVVHSFTNRQIDAANRPEMLRYDATADRHSWRAATALLDETLGGDR